MRDVPGKVLATLVVAGIAAGRPAGAVVLKTIVVDGNMADWTDVLADPLQTSADGTPDLDAPVPSTGRDLVRFAWTYDATYLYVYVSRVGSDSNRQRFWFYLDVNDDLRMSTGEPILGVSWSGSSGRTDVERWRYVAVSGAGDPMADAAGRADGYEVPGGVALVALLESATGGSLSGREMESRIPWTSLGVATGTPMRFHVSSSASTNLPSQVQDNMGAPDGGVGYIRVAAVRIDPDRTTTVMPAASAFLA